jgi:DNA-binding MarR family transcriptional regulator
MSHHAQHLARIMPLMRHVVSHLGVQSTESGKRLGLSNTRMSALAVALDAPGLTMSELASSLDLPAPLATRVTEELVERALMERFPDPSDRRRVLVRATPAGQQAVEDVHREAAVLIGDVLERMTTEEANALIFGLEALLRAMHDHDAPSTHHDRR